MGSAPLITVVDDDEGIRQSLDGLLRSAGYRAQTFDCAEAALADPEITHCDCVITDLQMQKLNGLDFSRELRAQDRTLPILLITAYPTAETERRAIAAGIRFLSKPFQATALLNLLEEMLEARPE